MPDIGPAHRPVYIHAAAALGPHQDIQADQRRVVTADLPKQDLRALTKAICGQSLRQASHLVELAMIAASACRQRLPVSPDPECAIYIGTGLGELEKTIALFEQVMPPASAMASPFDFINASSNMAAFYVAKSLGVSARNLTLSQDEFSFEWALKLAELDLRRGDVPQALVGGMDEFVVPRDYHIRRFALQAGEHVGEGSGWLFLTHEPAGALGRLQRVEHLPADLDETPDTWSGKVERRLGALTEAAGAVVLAPGFRLAEAYTAALAQRLGAATQPYLEYCGCFHTAAAFGIASHFDTPPAAPHRLVHVNRESGGQTMMVVIDVAGAG